MYLRFFVEVVAVVAHGVQPGEGGLVVHPRAFEVVEVGAVVGLQGLHQVPPVLEASGGRAEAAAVPVAALQ